jgi:hypothetical protein
MTLNESRNPLFNSILVGQRKFDILIGKGDGHYLGYIIKLIVGEGKRGLACPHNQFLEVESCLQKFYFKTLLINQLQRKITRDSLISFKYFRGTR